LALVSFVASIAIPCAPCVGVTIVIGVAWAVDELRASPGVRAGAYARLEGKAPNMSQAQIERDLDLLRDKYGGPGGKAEDRDRRDRIREIAATRPRR
jgi:hypothetical protein